MCNSFKLCSTHFSRGAKIFLGTNPPSYGSVFLWFFTATTTDRYFYAHLNKFSTYLKHHCFNRISRRIALAQEARNRQRVEDHLMLLLEDEASMHRNAFVVTTAQAMANIARNFVSCNLDKGHHNRVKKEYLSLIIKEKSANHSWSISVTGAKHVNLKPKSHINYRSKRALENFNNFTRHLPIASILQKHRMDVQDLSTFHTTAQVLEVITDSQKLHQKDLNRLVAEHQHLMMQLEPSDICVLQKLLRQVVPTKRSRSAATNLQHSFNEHET